MTEQRVRLLVIDDDEQLRGTLQRYLSTQFDYQVHTVSSGVAALERVSEHGELYDVALCDEVLGTGPDGIETMRQLKTLHPDLEAIIFTGWGATSKQQALRAGAFRYLEKPVDYDELAILIRAAAQQVRLREIGRAILSERNLERVLEMIAGAATSLALADDAAIILQDRATGALREYARIYSPGERWRRHYPARALTREIIESGRPVLVPDTRDARDLNPKIRQTGIRSFLGLPIPGEAGNLGVLYVYSQRDGRFEAGGTFSVLQTLAGQAGLALANASAFHQMQTHATHMETLVRAGQGLTGTVDSTEQLDLVWRFVRQQLQVTTSFVALYDSRRELLSFPLAYEQGEPVAIPDRMIGDDPASWGASGYVVKTGNELSWGNRDEEREQCAAVGIHPLRHGDPPHVQSCFCFPLKIGAKVLGVVSIQSTESHAFPPVLLDAFRALGSQLAVSLQNSRLFEQIRRTADQRSALNKMVLELGDELERRPLLVGIIQNVTRLLDAAGGGVYLLDQTGDFLALEASAGLSPDLEGERFERHQGLAGQILRSGQPETVDDYKNWPHRLPFLDGQELTAVAGAPVRVGDRLLGTLVIHDVLEERRFDASDLLLLQQFADHAGLALQKAELVAKLQGIQHLSTTIASSLRFQEVLDRTCQAAVELFGVEHGGLVIFDPEHRRGTVRGEYPEDPCTIGTRVPVQGVAAEEGLVLRGEILHVPDLREARTELGPVYEILDGFGIQSILVVPITFQGRVLGSFSLDTITHRRRFSEDEIDLCKTFAAHVAVAVENARLYEVTHRRGQLLAALDEASRHIRAEREPAKLLQQIVRLAVELADGSAGALFVNRPQLGIVQLRAEYGLPEDVIGHEIRHGEGLVGRVATTGRMLEVHSSDEWAEHEAHLTGYAFWAGVGLPLTQRGVVEAVLLIYSHGQRASFDRDDLEILERFADQAAIAWNTSRLMSREERMQSRLAILHQISNYIQTARDLDRILHIVLTGTTASYGLGFNRAALFLLDDRQEHLVGRMGIGHLREEDARRDWEADEARGLQSLEQYLELLVADHLSPTPVGRAIGKLRFPATSDSFHRFMGEVCRRRCLLATEDDMHGIPESFVAAFEPAFPLVVVPLIARGEPIGLLVADNKFSRYPITTEDQETLVTFANTAAIAIDNARLYQEAKTGQERLRSFYEASTAVASSRDLEIVLQDIVQRARAAARAIGVSMVLVDQGTGGIRTIITAGDDLPPDSGIIRPDGLSVEVMRTGRAVVIEEVEAERERVNPIMLARQIEAAACLPIVMKGERVGVMWFHYDERRRFSPAEIEAMQLYVNQAVLAYDSARRIKELEHLRQATEEMTGALGAAQVSLRIVESANKVLQCSSSAVWSYDAVRDRFVLEDSVASGVRQVPRRRFRQEESQLEALTQRVNAKGYLCVSNIEDGQRVKYLRASTREFLAELGIKSFQGIALKVGSETLGVLYESYDRARSFSDADRRILETFAHHAALALKKTKLLEQVSKAQDTAKVVAAVSVLGELQHTLNSIVDGTREALDCDAVTLYRYDFERDEFAFPPAMNGVLHPEEVLRLGRVAEASLIREILRADSMHIAQDAATDAIMCGPFVQREGIASSAGLPLRVGDHRVGVMFVNYRTRHRFTADELTSFALFANQAAVAIHNAQLFEAEQQYGKALEALQLTSAAVSSVLDPDELLPMTTEKAAEIFGAPATSLMLWDDEHENLVIRAAYGLGSRYRQEQRIDQATVREMIARVGWGPHVLDIGVVPIGKPGLVSGEGLSTALVAPLMRGGELMGVLNIYAKGGRRHFGEKEMELARIFANHAAIALDNAQLYRQQERRTRKLALINQVAAEISSSLDRDKILQTLVDELARAIEVEQCALALFDQEGEYGHVIAEYLEEGCVASMGTRIQLRDNPSVELLHQTKRSVVIMDAQHDPRTEAVWKILEERRTQSLMLVPIIIGDEVIGSIGLDAVNSMRRFDEDEQWLAETIAHHAAIAIQNAQLYEERKRRANTLNSLYEAGKAVTSSLTLNEILNHIVRQALRLTTAESHPIHVSHLALVEDNRLRFVAASPAGFLEELHHRVGEIDLQSSRRIGIVGRVAQTAKPQNVRDVLQDPDYIALSGEPHSQLSVPIMIGTSVCGVISVEHWECQAFDREHEEALNHLAAQAAIAIQNARAYSELERTRGQIAARLSVAWIGMVSARWRHAVSNHATTIRDLVALTRLDLQSDARSDQLGQRLDRIEEVVQKIREQQITAPLQIEEAVGSLSVNQLLKERTRQLWMRPRYEVVDLQLELQATESVTVRADSDWLRRALDILIDNAVDAMVSSAVKQLTISTALEGNRLEIQTKDTGPGIVEDVQKRLFSSPIPKPKGAEGLGIGLLLADTIVQTFGGEIRVGRTGPTGTTMTVRLPVERGTS